MAELFSDVNVRMVRSKTENRLLHKPSKRDLEKSEEIFRTLEASHRFNSVEDEIAIENYVRIDNTYMPPGEAAAMIKEKFAL